MGYSATLLEVPVTFDIGSPGYFTLIGTLIHVDTCSVVNSEDLLKIFREEHSRVIALLP
jgi:hypothetical protein